MSRRRTPAALLLTTVTLGTAGAHCPDTPAWLGETLQRHTFAIDEATRLAAVV